MPPSYALCREKQECSSRLVQCRRDVTDLLYEQQAARDSSKPDRLVKLSHPFVNRVDDDESRSHGLSGVNDSHERVSQEDFTQTLATQAFGEGKPSDKNRRNLARAAAT